MSHESGGILIIIPAYNESANIERVVRKVEDAGYDYVVVNDGSTDETLAICRRNGFNVLDLRENLGIGGAVQAGHKYAAQHGYDVDIQFDGDGQHDIAYVPALLQAIEGGADWRSGRASFLRSDGFQSTFMRRVGIRWLAFWIKVFTGRKTTDLHRAFARATGAASSCTAETTPWITLSQNPS